MKKKITSETETVQKCCDIIWLFENNTYESCEENLWKTTIPNFSKAKYNYMSHLSTFIIYTNLLENDIRDYLEVYHRKINNSRINDKKML